MPVVSVFINLKKEDSFREGIIYIKKEAIAVRWRRPYYLLSG